MAIKIFKKSLSLSAFVIGCVTFLIGAIGLFLTAIPGIHIRLWDILIIFGLLASGIILIGIGYYHLFTKRSQHENN